MAAVTRHGLYGGARSPYGSFSGKTPAVSTSNVVTVLGAHGYSKPPYADSGFDGKDPFIGPLNRCTYKSLICVTSTFNTPIDDSVTTVSTGITDILTKKSLICTTITLNTPIDDSVTTVDVTISC